MEPPGITIWNTIERSTILQNVKQYHLKEYYGKSPFTTYNNMENYGKIQHSTYWDKSRTFNWAMFNSKLLT